MASIYDVVTANEIATYWVEQRKERTPFMGVAFFPPKQQLGLDLSWFKGADKNPVALQISAFDAKAIPLSRQGFEKVQTEMPFFKNSMNVDEKQRQQLNTVLATGNQQAIDLILGKVYDDETTLLENADIAREIMRMQLMTTGVISLKGNGQSYTYDYKLGEDQKVSTNWSTTTTADPITDITTWQDTIENKTGYRPKNLIMNLNTFNMISKCDSVKNAIYILGEGKVRPNRTKVKQFIAEETECRVIIYDKGYTNEETGKFVKFIPDKTVVLAPDTIGSTWFGTTPEESDLMNSNVANVSIVDTGVAVTTTKETDPVNVMTKVSMICMPSGENTDKLVIATIS